MSESHPVGAARTPDLLTWLLFAIISVLLALIILTRPDVLITADTLPLAEFTWDLLHRDDVWRNFQQSHSPCLFPDLLIQWPVHAITGSWRAASCAHTLFIATWSLGIVSWIAARISGRDIRTAILASTVLIAPLWILAVLTAPITVGETNGGGVFLPYILQFLPGGYHGGPFLLAMSTACVGSPDARIGSRARGLLLLLLCFGGGTSDLLFTGFAMVPLTAAQLGGFWAKRRPAAPFSHLIVSWVGFGIGLLLQLSLPRQGMLRYPLSLVVTHLGWFLFNFGRHLDLVLILLLFVVTLRRRFSSVLPRDWAGDYWLVFALVSGIGSLTLVAGVYVNVWTFRYGEPFIWWPVIFAAAWLSEPMRWRHGLTAMTGALTLICAALGAWPPGLLVWHPPLAQCLLDAGLKAGLADFWHARQTSAVSDWRLQIEPLIDGRPLVWGNDPRWFVKDIHAAAGPPPYEFIVMDDLDQTLIRNKFGGPRHVIMCGKSEVWVYDQDGALYRALTRDAPAAGQ